MTCGFRQRSASLRGGPASPAPGMSSGSRIAFGPLAGVPQTWWLVSSAARAAHRLSGRCPRDLEGAVPELGREGTAHVRL